MEAGNSAVPCVHVTTATLNRDVRTIKHPQRCDGGDYGEIPRSGHGCYCVELEDLGRSAGLLVTFDCIRLTLRSALNVKRWR
jgi:hypothetical protein